MKPKHENTIIGEILSEHKFVGGKKYWRIKDATIFDQKFEIGDRVLWVDDEDEERSYYFGNILWMMIDDKGSVEVSIDNLLVGRLDLEELNIFKHL